MAIRLDHLPPAAMPLFNGSVPAAVTDKVDSVVIYKNGGVGALGHSGVREAAVQPERWAWLVVTRNSNHEVCTYVNGRLCAKVDVTVKQPKSSEGKGKKGKEGASEASDAKESSESSKGGTASRLPERLCIDPQYLALFGAEEPAESTSRANTAAPLLPSTTPQQPGVEPAAVADAGRGLAVRYIMLSTECWDAEEVHRQLERLRSKDEEADVADEAEAARVHQLSLQPLYAKPPPIWLHPAFAAEFGDAFIAGTSLAARSMLCWIWTRSPPAHAHAPAPAPRAPASSSPLPLASASPSALRLALASALALALSVALARALTKVRVSRAVPSTFLSRCSCSLFSRCWQRAAPPSRRSRTQIAPRSMRRSPRWATPSGSRTSLRMRLRTTAISASSSAACSRLSTRSRQAACCRCRVPSEASLSLCSSRAAPATTPTSAT